MQFRKEISKDELAAMNLQKFMGVIHLIEDEAGLEKVMPILRTATLLGVDTETRPSFRKGVVYRVALLQFAMADEVFVFRLNKLGLPDPLVKILNSRKIIKAGIAVHDDMKDLRILNPAVKPQSVIDLNKLALSLGFISIGAKKLSALTLGFSISKKEQTSNWEVENLTESQLNYAATDAWVAYHIYEKLMENEGI